MGRRLLIAGLLQYSEPLYDQIEDHLLRVYAALFVPSLEATIKQSESKLAQMKELVERVGELGAQLKKAPNQNAFQELLSLLMPMALSGVLDVDLHGLVNALQQGDVSKVRQILQQLEGQMQELGKAAEEQLGGTAEGMKKDLEEWKKLYDPKLAKAIDQQAKSGKLDDLVIELKPEHFPFLQGKFSDNVRKVRGEDAGLFNKLKEIKVRLASLRKGAMGLWDGQGGELVVGVPQLRPLRAVQSELRHTIRHELTHATQTVMADALGVQHLRMDKDGNMIPMYRPGPGMGPKETLDPEVHQAFANFDHLQAQIKKLEKYEAGGTIKPEQKKALHDLRQIREMRKKVLSSRKIKSGQATYSMDDMEFYTHLADRVWEFEDKLRQLELNAEQKELARDLWIGRKWMPQKSKEKGLAWIAQHDPSNAVWPHFSQGSPFFFDLKKNQPKKYQKAIKEFVKATESQFDEPKPEGGLEKQWEEFLSERYDGGKKKVGNPNPKTRDAHPEISVNYLMNQTDGAYKSARAKVRREFARWRSRQKMPTWMRGWQRG